MKTSMQTILAVCALGCAGMLAGCAEGPVHYTEGGEFHGNTPHNDDARTEKIGGHRDNDYRDRND